MNSLAVVPAPAAAGFTPVVIERGGFGDLSATPTSEVREQRQQSNSAELSHAGGLVLSAFLALDPLSHAQAGKIEVQLPIPVCERMDVAVRQAFQSCGFYTEGIRVTPSEKPNHVQLSWSSATRSHSSW